MAEADTVSHKSPYYDDLDAGVTQRLGLPTGLLPAIRTRGERSNSDQISDAGAKTVYQIIPETRDAALKKWGVDAYLNPSNAAQVAGLLLKDSLERNSNVAPLAVAEYVGGTDPKNWGPDTRAYVRRVTGENLVTNTLNPKQSTYDRLVAKQIAANTPQISRVYDAYKNGQMAPEDKAAFEADVAAGRVLPPKGAKVAAAPAAAVTANGPPNAPQGVIDAYTDQKMTPADRHDFETDVAEGRVKVPDGTTIAKPEGWGKRAADATFEAISGAARETEQTRKLPDWVGMPELNQLTSASAKTGLGTMFAGPAEAVKIIKANYPDTKVTQDEKGNYLLTSSVDGKEYAIKPGFQWGDVPRALGTIAAFAPAAQVAKVVPAALAAGGTEAVIQGTQAATGGDFNASDVALAAAGGAAVPVAARVIEAAKPAVVRAVDAVKSRIPGAAARAETPPGASGIAPVTEPPTAPIVPPAPPVEPPAAAAVPPVPPAAAPTAPAASAAPAAAAQTAEELAQVTRTAAGGGLGSKAAKAELAQAAAPDAETLAAAKRLGIEDHLQPDHVTTNDAYRTLAAVVKSIPASEAKAAEVQGLAKVAERADQIITELGGSRDLSALNAGVKSELSRIEKDLKTQAGELYDAVRDRVLPKTPAPADNVLKMIKARADELGGEAHLTAGERKILTDLTPKDGVQPTYALLDQTRKDIGAAARGANETFGTRDSKLLGDLGKALTLDQEAVAAAAGAGELWNAARAATVAYKGIQNDLIGLFGKTLSNSIVGDLSNSTKALAKGDISGFVQLVKATPESMRHEVVASGLASAFNSNAAKGGINFNNYAQWFEGLQRNTLARDALFSNLPKAAVQRLTDLYKVSKGIAASTGQFIATGRLLAAPVKQILEADNLMAHVFDVAKKAGAAEAITSTMGLPGAGMAAAVGAALTKGRTPIMKAADSLINSPEFIAAARNASKNNINRLARSSKFAAFVKAAGTPREMKDREKWIASALQAKKESGQ